MKLYFRTRAWSLALVSIGASLATTQASAWYSTPHQWRPAAAPVSTQTAVYHRAANLPAFRPARTSTRDRFARAQPKRMTPASAHSRQLNQRRYGMQRPMPPIRQAMTPAQIAPFAGGGMPFVQPMMARMWPPMPPQPQAWQPPQQHPAFAPLSTGVATGYENPSAASSYRDRPTLRTGQWPASRAHSRWRPVEPAAAETTRYGQRGPFDNVPDRRRQAGLSAALPAPQFATPASRRLLPPATALQWRPAAHMNPRVSYQTHSAFRPLSYGRPAGGLQSGLASVGASAHTPTLPGWVTTYHGVDRVDCDYCRGG